MKKTKKIKINQKKFLRNIIIVIIALIVIEKIIDIAPGYKRDKEDGKTKFILNEEELTENLKNPVYINENNTIYLSKEDIKNYFDESIYYDEMYSQIITTSDTKVANMKINEKSITVNETEISTLDSAIIKDNIIYIPISELELTYNIKINYIKDKDIVVVDNLNKGMIVANVSENTKIKYKPRALSKSLGELQSGSKVYCFYTTSKGWREIRTEDGILGYIKANKLTNEYIVRQDMQNEITTKKLENINKNEIFIVDNKETVLKKLTDTDIEEMKNKYDIWVEISNSSIENESNKIISDYTLRTQLIDNFVELVTKSKVQGVIVDFANVTDLNNLERLIIELSPKLREVGIRTCIKMNEKMDEKNLEKYVDYMI